MDRFNIFRYLPMASAIVLAFSAPSVAQHYPDRPVRLIVPYAAGGTTDTLARLVGNKMSEALGQPFIVENRPGASTMIGTDVVAKAPADGYTVLIAGSSLATTVLIYKDKVPYKISDLAPIGLISKTPMAVEVTPSLPVHSVKELIAYATANPRKLNYATFGKGTIPHLTCELLSQTTGIKMVDVSYKGAAPAMNDLLGGVIQVFCDVSTTSVPLSLSGKTRVLAIMNEERIAFAPDVPTFAELGYPDIIASTTIGFLAPAGTPRPIIERLSAELAKIVNDPEISARIIKFGSVPLSGGPEEFAAVIGNEQTRWEKVVRRLDLPGQ